MKVSRLNHIAQLVATIGVIIGLGLVAYEIRENNAIAFQQAVSTNWVTWTDLEMSQIQSGFPEAFTKSITNAEDLTLSEQVILNAWLSAVMSAWEQDYASISLANGSASGVLDELSATVPFYFGNGFTRAWFFENRNWLTPELASVIEEKLTSTPLGSDREYFEGIMRAIPDK